MSVRIPNPTVLAEHQSGSDYFACIPKENSQKYEVAVLNSLLKFIKLDDILMHFHMRLVCECENICKVIEVAKEVDILNLEDIITNLSNAKNIEAVSLHDSEFHRTLFTITGNPEFFKWWRKRSNELANFLGEFWSFIGYKSTHYHDLIDMHKRIFDAIKKRDKEAAVEAMQDHFAILLYQLLGKTYKKS